MSKETVIVSPGVRPVTFHETNPCGNVTFDGLPEVVRLPSDTAVTFESVPLLADISIVPVPVAEITSPPSPSTIVKVVFAKTSPVAPLPEYNDTV